METFSSNLNIATTWLLARAKSHVVAIFDENVLDNCPLPQLTPLSDGLPTADSLLRHSDGDSSLVCVRSLSFWSNASGWHVRYWCAVVKVWESAWARRLPPHPVLPQTTWGWPDPHPSPFWVVIPRILKMRPWGHWGGQVGGKRETDFFFLSFLGGEYPFYPWTLEVDRKKPPPGGFSYFLCSLIKNPEEEEPHRWLFTRCCEGVLFLRVLDQGT